MTRGGTPTFVVELDNVDISKIKQIYATIKQDKITITKKMSSMTVLNGTISFTLTQQETLRFIGGKAQLQLRLLTNDNKVLCTDIFDIKVLPVLSGEVIE